VVGDMATLRERVQHALLVSRNVQGKCSRMPWS
jgi:hypothetical protein